MRVLLVGPAPDRVRLRAKLEEEGLLVVGEFARLQSAQQSRIRFDAIVLTPGSAVEPSIDVQPPRDERLVEPLTPRELEVLELLAEGLPNKAIAARLGISDQTAKFHVASICGKLGALNRTEAVRRAIRSGLITL